MSTAIQDSTAEVNTLEIKSSSLGLLGGIVRFIEIISAGLEAIGNIISRVLGIREGNVSSLKNRVQSSTASLSILKNIKGCPSTVKRHNEAVQAAKAAAKRWVVETDPNAKNAAWDELVKQKGIVRKCQKAIEIARAFKEAIVVAKSHRIKFAKIILILEISQRDFLKNLRDLPDAIREAHLHFAESGLNELPEDLTSADQICRSLLEGPKEGNPIKLRVLFFQKLITSC